MSIKVLLVMSTLLTGSVIQAANSNPPMANDTTKEGNNSSYQEVRTQDLKALQRFNSGLIIIDARTSDNDNGRRIPGAKFLPYDSKDETINTVLPNKDTMIVVYCSNPQCPASEFLAKHLADMGYFKVFKYSEGLEGWEKAGNPVELNRSTQSKETPTKS